MNKYETTIGLEVHAQLLTKSKMFCGCKNEYGAKANSLTCPVCSGMPGALPHANRKAVELSIKTALALNCRVHGYSKFDRKNYFYPDMPKNYQISQYDNPIATDGYVTLPNGKIIGIERVHIEEDAGKLTHSDKGSLIDLNRAGVPLLEIVSKPEINSPENAYEYLNALKLILTYIEVCDCNMQEGSLRCDANVSVKPVEQSGYGVKVEIKNMNSFHGVQKALEYEVNRQIKLYENGTSEFIVQETRLWDEEKIETQSMRSKEHSHDYRYFPEPDLPPLKISKEWIEEIENTICELPFDKQQRYIKDYLISAYDSEVIIADKDAANYFDECVKAGMTPKDAVNWIANQIFAVLKEKRIPIKEMALKADNLFSMVTLLNNKKITNKIARDILPVMIETGRSPEKIINEMGLKVFSDEKKLNEMIAEMLAENADVVNDYINGKQKAFGYFMGHIMHQTDNQADATLLRSLLNKALEEYK